MKKTGFVLVIYVVSIILEGCSSSVPLCQSRWQDKPVTVDGKLTEWTIPLDFSDKGTRLNYVISNDDSNLYYWIRITDEKEQIRIMRAGIQFWIDTSGKNKQQVGIEFPYSPLINATDTSLNKSTRKWTGKFDQVKLTGFSNAVNGITQMPNPYGIKMCIARDSNGGTLYEARIPFKTFYKPCLSSADDNKQFGITIIINPLPTPNQPSKMHAHGGDGGGYGGPGGMGMGYPGGMGSYRTYQKNNDEEGYNLESAKLKMALRLSVK